MEKRLGRHNGFKNIYIHNDLSGVSHHFKRTIESKLAANKRKGIAFDYMARLVMHAFAFEAQVNFSGSKLIQDWGNDSPSMRKLTGFLISLILGPIEASDLTMQSHV